MCSRSPNRWYSFAAAPTFVTHTSEWLAATLSFFSSCHSFIAHLHPVPSNLNALLSQRATPRLARASACMRRTSPKKLPPLPLCVTSRTLYGDYSTRLSDCSVGQRLRSELDGSLAFACVVVRLSAALPLCCLLLLPRCRSPAVATAFAHLVDLISCRSFNAFSRFAVALGLTTVWHRIPYRFVLYQTLPTRDLHCIVNAQPVRTCQAGANNTVINVKVAFEPNQLTAVCACVSFTSCPVTVLSATVFKVVIYSFINSYSCAQAIKPGRLSRIVFPVFLI